MSNCTEIQCISMDYFQIRGPWLKKAKRRVNFPLSEGKSFHCMINGVFLNHQNTHFLEKVVLFHRFTFLDFPIDFEVNNFY